MARIIDRITFAVIGAMALALIAVFAGLVRAGSLDPTAAPGSTMRPLDELSGSWSRNLSATGGCNSPRFRCVFGDNAALDLNTGLVWSRFPASFGNAFATAVSTCANDETGGVKGWRLPSTEEMMSLVEPNNVNPALPTGHPFLNFSPGATVWATSFWGTTQNSQVLAVNMATGELAILDAGTATAGFWCVRAGRGFDGIR